MPSFVFCAIVVKYYTATYVVYTTKVANTLN